MKLVSLIKNQTIDDFLCKNTALGNYIEIPSLIDAYEQEIVLNTMVNRNYHFEIWVSYNNTLNNSPVYKFILKFDDNLTKTEYEFLK